MGGTDTTRTSTASLYGGYGGYGASMSTSTGLSSGFEGGAVVTNEKWTMQNLNERLASYLEKVRSLEAANRKLELQIREYYEKRTPSVSKDVTAFFVTISGLREQIAKRYIDNQRVILQIDNAKLAADDFRLKYEMELNMKMSTEADVTRLRGVKESLILAKNDLEMQIEGLKEELMYMKRNHEEEMRLLRVQQTGTVNVEVDNAESVDLNKVLEEMREQYESVMQKNKLELEKWYQSKVESFRSQIITSKEEVKTVNTQMSELKRTYQSLEITRSSTVTQLEYLQQNLEEVKSRYGLQLSQLQMTINTLEVELQQLKVSIEQQQTEYNALLDVKMRLELEIAEYRRLLEGEILERRVEEKKAIIISKVVEKKVEVEDEYNPLRQRRVRTIVENIVDGVVVSQSVDTEVQDVK